MISERAVRRSVRVFILLLRLGGSLLELGLASLSFAVPGIDLDLGMLELGLVISILILIFEMTRLCACPGAKMC